MSGCCYINFLLDEIGASFCGVIAWHGYEKLRGDGSLAVQTPLATTPIIDG